MGFRIVFCVFSCTAILKMSLGSLPICKGGNVTKLQICSFNIGYKKGDPDFDFSEKGAMKLMTAITLSSIDDFDEEHRTISLNILLVSRWNDTRITLENNDPEK